MVIEKKFEKFSPVYNNVEVVKKCASIMLKEEVIEARIAIVIGHNCRNFISSTDWRLTTKSGNKRILPFSVMPQYPNFLEATAGHVECVEKGEFFSVPDPKGFEMKSCVILEGKEYYFQPGEALKIYVQPGSRFIATDCLVEYEELENLRVYKILPDEETAYGIFDNNGNISMC